MKRAQPLDKTQLELNVNSATGQLFNLLLHSLLVAILWNMFRKSSISSPVQEATDNLSNPSQNVKCPVAKYFIV